MLTGQTRDDSLSTVEGLPVERPGIAQRLKGVEPAEDLNAVVVTEIQHGLVHRNAHATGGSDLLAVTFNRLDMKQKTGPLTATRPAREWMRSRRRQTRGGDDRSDQSRRTAADRSVSLDT